MFMNCSFQKAQLKHTEKKKKHEQSIKNAFCDVAITSAIFVPYSCGLLITKSYKTAKLF